jgi:hypothetical protein
MVVREPDQVPAPEEGPSVSVDTDVNGDRLVFMGNHAGRSFTLTVLDSRTGGRVADYTFDSLGSIPIGPIRLSPDGRYAAFFHAHGYKTEGGGGERYLAVVDVQTGAVRHDQLLAPNLIGYSPEDPTRALIPAGKYGLAWIDQSTLRVAVAEVPAADRMYTVEELLKVQTVKLG